MYKELSQLKKDKIANQKKKKKGGRFPWWLSGKESACHCGKHRFNPWVREIPLEKEIATHSSILASEIPWTEEPGWLQSIGSQRVRHA